MQEQARKSWNGIAVVRWLLILAAAFMLAVSLVGLVRFPEYAIRHTDRFVLNQWTFAQVQAALAALGWPSTTLAWFDFARNLMGMLIFLPVGGLILSKKRDDWFALFLVFVFLVISPVSGSMIEPALEIWPGLVPIFDFAGAFGWQFFFLFFYFFPDGRAVPRWTVFYLPVWFAISLYSHFSLHANTAIQSNPFVITMSFLFVFLGIGSQVYRYLRHSDSVQRQQTKWVVYTLMVTVVAVSLSAPRAFSTPDLADLPASLIRSMLFLCAFSIGFFFIPVSIVIAIFRYRLWDIDLIIRRTLVYGLVTALLGLVYFGAVVVFREFFRLLTGQESPAAIVLSTLVIAALFNPIRQRIQSRIDRQFYRQRYDSARALETFSTAVRNQVDFEQVQNSMTDVVVETMAPTNVSLWLRTETKKEK